MATTLPTPEWASQNRIGLFWFVYARPSDPGFSQKCGDGRRGLIVEAQFWQGARWEAPETLSARRGSPG
eukprot:11210022-Lingulodinium_polyedra.AAC.1